MDKNTMDLRQEILTNDLGNRMLNMVAPVYNRSKVALHLFQALGIFFQPEMDFVWGDYVKQLYPQTATWGLEYWEEEYGIVTDLNKPIDQRRAYLLSVMYKRYPMTPKRLEQLVKGITGFECEVTENIAPNTFGVIIRGYVKDTTPVIQELDQKSPAHLNYTLRVGETMYTDVLIYPAVAGGNVKEKIEGIEVLS